MLQLSLLDALGLRETACVALTGAGGKTSALFRLAREHAQPVFLSTSAHLALDQLALADRAYAVASPADLPDFSGGIPPGVTLFHGPRLADKDRVTGLDEPTLTRLRELAGYHAVPLLIEADGSRRLPLKAPADHEPPIPAWVGAVVVCAGLNGLGAALSDETVFRAGLFARLSGLALGQNVTTDGLSSLLSHPQGGLKNIPATARRCLLLNQASTPDLRAAAAQIAPTLLRDYDCVLTAELRGPGPTGNPALHSLRRPCAVILLAAGASRRLGKPKQTLDWRGEPLVRRAARAALESGLGPLVVVSGASAAAVETALEGLPVHIEPCPNWQEGQSASLKAGLRAALRLRPTLGAAAFLLCDQPYVGPDLLQALATRHAETLAPAVAPFIAERRANPVLFDRALFPALFELQGDSGGRQLLAGHSVAALPWPDARILLDIDTLEDYQTLREQG